MAFLPSLKTWISKVEGEEMKGEKTREEELKKEIEDLELNSFINASIFRGNVVVMVKANVMHYAKLRELKGIQQGKEQAEQEIERLKHNIKIMQEHIDRLNEEKGVKGK